MADSSRSAVTDSDFHPESYPLPAACAPVPHALGIPRAGSERSAAAPVHTAGDAWFPSESGDDLEWPGSQHDRAEPRDGETKSSGRRDRSSVSWWALPLLTLVVVLETGWLLKGPFLPSEPAAAALATSASSVPPAARSTGLPDGARVGAGSPISADSPGAKTPDRQPAIVPASAERTVAGVTGADGAASKLTVEPGRVFIPLPFQVQVYEGGRFVGVNDGSLPLSPGTHQLQLVNDSLEFRTTQRVAIASGRTTRLNTAVPSVPVQLNAVPWAEVTIDGTRVGETPLGNVPMAIGPHTIVFRHPQFGEETRNVVVTAESPTRISVDLRK